MSKLTLISGLYKNIRGGELASSDRIRQEICDSITHNPHYRNQLICYADSKESADFLKNQGCYVHKVFDDAPSDIIFDAKHKMKHWIMYNAAKEFGNVLWIDWVTLNIKPVDDKFENHCLSSPHPKFTWINNYWAIVNCSVYYLNESSLGIMKESFSAKVPEPNDELLWASVLPPNVRNQKEYWLNDLVINIWLESEFSEITPNTYFLHLKDFSMLNRHFI